LDQAHLVFSVPESHDAKKSPMHQPSTHGLTHVVCEAIDAAKLLSPAALINDHRPLGGEMFWLDTVFEGPFVQLQHNLAVRVLTSGPSTACWHSTPVNHLNKADSACLLTKQIFEGFNGGGGWIHVFWEPKMTLAAD
jgi:hypothetical protein